MKYPETAKRLLFAMANADISQQELANRSGINKSSISHYVNGSHEPGNKAAYAMANALDVNPLWLMGIDGVSPVMQQSVTLEVSNFESQLIHAFRNASEDTQNAVCAVLGIKDGVKKPKARPVIS